MAHREGPHFLIIKALKKHVLRAYPRQSNFFGRSIMDRWFPCPLVEASSLPGDASLLASFPGDASSLLASSLHPASPSCISHSLSPPPFPKPHPRLRPHDSGSRRHADLLVKVDLFTATPLSCLIVAADSQSCTVLTIYVLFIFKVYEF